jgi:hypothetical protein
VDDLQYGRFAGNTNHQSATGVSTPIFLLRMADFVLDSGPAAPPNSSASMTDDGFD